MDKRMGKDTYRTRDLFEASFLYMSRLKFLGLVEDGNSTAFYFEFQDRVRAEMLSNAFWAKTARANVREFCDAFRTLKDALFARKRGPYT